MGNLCNEYKSPEYYLFSIYSHRDINLPIIRFPHPIERAHYFWSSCSRCFDRYRLISIVCVPNRHDTPLHWADPVEVPVLLIHVQQLIDTVAYHNRIPAKREKNRNIKRIRRWEEKNRTTCSKLKQPKKSCSGNSFGGFSNESKLIM